MCCRLLRIDRIEEHAGAELRGGQVPDVMGDNIEIVAEGKLDTQGTFTATNVLAKCPSRLEDAAPEERDYQ